MSATRARSSSRSSTAGARDDTHGNAIAQARAAELERIARDAIRTRCSKRAAKPSACPHGVMGNSEVGHINIGSGRVVPQGIVVIDERDRRRHVRERTRCCSARIEHVRNDAAARCT